MRHFQDNLPSAVIWANDDTVVLAYDARMHQRSINQGTLLPV